MNTVVNGHFLHVSVSLLFIYSRVYKLFLTYLISYKHFAPPKDRQVTTQAQPFTVCCHQNLLIKNKTAQYGYWGEYKEYISL